MDTIKAMVAGLIIAVLITGCATTENPQSSVYTREQAQQVQRVETGEVVYVRPVVIEGTKTGFGAIAGGVLGYVVGGTIGGGSGKDVARAAGAVGGAVAGGAIEKGVTKTNGLEINVHLDNGEVIAIVQGDDVPFNVGDRVKVLIRPDGRARVVQ